MGLNEFIQIGKRIKEVRKSKGLAQREVANRLGIPFSTYSNYENDNREPNGEMLERIASVLNISVSDLMSWDEQYPDMKNEVARYEGFLGYLQSLGYTVLDVDVEDGSITLSKDGHTVHFLKTEFQSLETASSDMIAFKFWQMATHSQQNQ